MTNNQVTLLATVTAGCFGLLGNLGTAFGPSWVSWGKKPSYVDTEVYKELVRDNSRLTETIEGQLLHIESYYLKRDLVFAFKERKADRIIIEATNTTEVKNALDRKIRYEHSASFLEDTEYLSLMITGEDGHTIKLNSKELFQRRSQLPAGIVTSTIPQEIPPKGKITIESRFVLTKPLWFQEPMVTGRLIAGPMKITLRKGANLEKLNVGYLSLAFGRSLPELQDQEGNRVITVPGPVFSGQGVAITWKWTG